MERSVEHDAAVPSLDSACISAPDLQRLSEGIPPDQRRLDLEQQVRKLEQLQVAVASKLRVARARCNLAAAESELITALAEEAKWTEDKKNFSLIPSAPTDCKVVHTNKAIRKRARRRQRQLELQQSLQKEKERQEPEPETALKPVYNEWPKPIEGIVQQRIASFEALTPSNETVQPDVEKFEPDKALEPAVCADVPESREDEKHPGSSPCFVMASNGVGAAQAGKGHEPDDLLVSTKLIWTDIDSQPEVEQFEPLKALEPAVCAGVPEPSEDVEHPGSSPCVVMASNGVGVTLTEKAHETNDLLVSTKPSWADIASSSDDSSTDDCAGVTDGDSDVTVAQVAAIYASSCLSKERQQFWIQQLHATCELIEDPTSLQALLADMKLHALQIAAARRGTVSLPAQDAPT